MLPPNVSGSQTDGCTNKQTDEQTDGQWKLQSSFALIKKRRCILRYIVRFLDLYLVRQRIYVVCVCVNGIEIGL